MTGQSDDKSAQARTQWYRIAGPGLILLVIIALVSVGGAGAGAGAGAPNRRATRSPQPANHGVLLHIEAPHFLLNIE